MMIARFDMPPLTRQAGQYLARERPWMPRRPIRPIDRLDAARGILVALPIAAVLWAAVFIIF